MQVDRYRVLVLGLGSMGRRRLRLLSRFFPDITLGGSDQRGDRRKAAEAEFSCPVFADFEEALRVFRPDALVVSTSPSHHKEFVLEGLRRGLHTFSELDLLADGYEELCVLERAREPAAFLSSTMLFREENRWIAENHGRIWRRKFYAYHVGQYLPDWHPWERYDAFFVREARTNAIREILAIEMPWLLWGFGKVMEYHVLWGKTSALNLPYPDTCQLLLRHGDGTQGALTIDCVARCPVRDFRLDGEEGFLVWHGTRASLKVVSPSGETTNPLSEEEDCAWEPGYADFISERPYLEELRCFLNRIAGKPETVPRYGYAEHGELLLWLDELERGWRGA